MVSSPGALAAWVRVWRVFLDFSKQLQGAVHPQHFARREKPSTRGLSNHAGSTMEVERLLTVEC